MTWLTRHQIRTYLRNSSWPAPAAAIPVALVALPLVRVIDERTRWELLDYTSSQAVSLLSAITPAALTMVVLILSMLLLAVQLASSQFSPRLIGSLIARRPVKICQFLFVFTYVFCAGAMARSAEHVPQLSVVVAVLCTLLSVATGLFLIDYLAKELRPVRMLARTADEGRAVIEHVYPNLITADNPAQEMAAHGQAAIKQESVQTICRNGHSGVMLAVDLRGLMSLAQEAGCVIEIVPQVGDFVARGDPLFRIHPGLQGVAESRLAQSIAFGNERTYEQDPAFAFRILVDVACRALSAAINDPTTAVLAIDQIHHLLRQVGRRRLDSGCLSDAAGQLRLIYRTPGWEDYVHLAVTEIRQYGSGSIQVARRLRAMLENLIGTVPPARVPILQEQLRLLQRSVKRNFTDPEDRESAQQSDYQGMGGSEEDKEGDPAASRMKIPDIPISR